MIVHFRYLNTFFRIKPALANVEKDLLQFFYIHVEITLISMQVET